MHKILNYLIKDNILNIGFESYQSVLTPIYNNKSDNLDNQFQYISNISFYNTSNISINNPG